MVETYFAHPSYWKIDGKPYFTIYDMSVFLDSFGSVDGSRRALDLLRAMVDAAGHPGLHVNAILWGHDHDFHEISFVLPRSGRALDRCGHFQDLARRRDNHPARPPALVQTVRRTRADEFPVSAEWLLEDLNLLLDEEGIVPLFFSSTLFNSPLYMPALQFPLLPDYWQQFTGELMALAKERDCENPSKLLLKSGVFRLMRLLDLGLPTLTITGAIILACFYPITEARARKIRSELEKRRGTLAETN